MREYKYSWDGPNKIPLTIQGRAVELKGVQDPAKPSSWKAHLIRLAFVTTSIEAGSYVQAIRPIPFRSNFMNVPEYLAEEDTSTRSIESGFDLIFLQLNQKVFYDRAQGQFIALKDKMGIAAAKRLQAISGLLEEAYLRSRDGSDNPRNLLLAYETSYAGDRWIRSLEASVALSERKYAEAVKILSKALGEPGLGPPTPTRVGLSAMYAVSLTRLAREVQADPSTRAKATEYLSEARQILQTELQRAPTSGTEPALRWHLALVDVYLRSDEAAIKELSTLTIKNAEPLLVARAKNSVGYLMLLDGRLEEAEHWFIDSSSIAPELATPRINRGYVLLVKGRYTEAEAHLRSLLEGADRLPAERDRMLARLALALCLDAEKKTVAATAEYQSVLRDLRGVGVTEVDDTLGPAFVRLTLAKEVYLKNRDYYALEIWGAVTLGSSCQLLCTRSKESDSALFSEIRAEINQNAVWVFEVAEPRAALLQHRNGILSNILPRNDQPCRCAETRLDTTPKPRKVREVSQRVR